MGGFALGAGAQAALAKSGIRAIAWTWQHRAGSKGGIFPTHQALNGSREADISNFGVLPQGDVNGDYCRCLLRPDFRDSRGRFAPAPR